MPVLVLAIKGATQCGKGFGEREDLGGQQQVRIVSAHRMPINTIHGDGDLRNQIRARKGETLLRKVSHSDAANHPIFCADFLSVEEQFELLCLGVVRHRRGQSYPEAFGSSALNTPAGTRPTTLSTMAVVTLRSRAIQADLQDHAFTR